MRFILALGILLNSSLLTATTINSGSFTSYTNYSGFNVSSNLFSGPDISINVVHWNSAPFCAGLPGSTCNVSFNQDFNIVADLTFSPRTPSAVVIYGGNTYEINLGPATPPNSSLILNMSFAGPTVPVLLGAGCPGCSVFGGTNGVPFTMNGTATLTVNGIVIFSNLALSGSGLAAFTSANHPQPLEGTSVMTYAFEAAPTGIPEPASYATAAAGLLGLALLRQRKR